MVAQVWPASSEMREPIGLRVVPVPHHRPVDHDDALRIAAVRLGERPPLHERDAQRPEEIRADDARIGRRPFVGSSTTRPSI